MTKKNSVTALIVILHIAFVVRPGQGQETGIILEDAAIYSELASPSFSTLDLPSKVDWRDTFPTPGNQGQQGSCVGWACAFALKSHQEEMERSWGVERRDRHFSPAYIFNQIKVKVTDKNGNTLYDSRGNVRYASRIYDALNLMVREGVSPWADFPYTDQDMSKLPSSSLKQRAFKFRIASFKTISPPQDLSQLKARIAGQQPVVVGMKTDASFHEYRGQNVYSYKNGVFDAELGAIAEKHGSHAVVLAGYDEDQQCFYLVNSWGTSWGEDGYMKISYAAMRERIQCAYAARDFMETSKIEVDDDSPWLYPDSDKKRLSPVELGSRSAQELWRARNEIFARRGYVFGSERGKQFAASLGRHYNGRFNHEQTEAQFNQFEHYNIAQIIAIEWGRGDRLGPLPPNTWIFSDSNVRRLTRSEVASRSDDELWKARNEIFARRGFIFQTDRGKRLADSLGHLYSPVSGDMDRIYQTFNAIEKFNVDLIRAFETGGAVVAPQQPPAPATQGVWVFADSSTRYLTSNEVSGLSSDQLWRARNEIYARRGHQFSSDRGRALATRLGSVYNPRSGDAYARMNAIEKANIALIRQYE